MMLGFLLARAGVKVMVLEKHQDFLRDFRGDTIHPSTLELMHELGLLQEFLKLPHGKVHHISADRNDQPADCPLHPSAYAVPLHCNDAAVGFSQLLGQARRALSGLRSADEGGSPRN